MGQQRGRPAVADRRRRGRARGRPEHAERDRQTVPAQARERLHYAYPRETRYIVPTAAPTAAATEGATRADPEVGPESGPESTVAPAATGAQPWYRDLWEGLGG